MNIKYRDIEHVIVGVDGLHRIILPKRINIKHNLGFHLNFSSFLDSIG